MPQNGRGEGISTQCLPLKQRVLKLLELIDCLINFLLIKQLCYTTVHSFFLDGILWVNTVKVILSLKLLPKFVLFIWLANTRCNTHTHEAEWVEQTLKHKLAHRATADCISLDQRQAPSQLCYVTETVSTGTGGL